jgi:hypothetical protein
MDLWLPTSESQLESAIANGSISESHYFDFKRELKATDGARKETAIDLASFALDGGVVIVGVEEPTSDQFALAPIQLADISERVEQIAANRIEPGLFIRTYEIPSPDHPGMGYLVIEVPPSTVAPHMVDGRYWGRSEKTKRPLSDPEVFRLHLSRTATEDKVRAALAEELERDPAPRPTARMFLVAVPLQADAGVARSFVRAGQDQMIQFAGVAEKLLPTSLNQLSTSPHHLHSAVRRARGIARTNLMDARTVKDTTEAEEAEDIEVQLSGSIRILTSAISYQDRSPRLEGTQLFVRTGHLVAWTHRLIGYAAHLGQALGYRGPWGLGVHIYGLIGARAGVEKHRAFQLPIYDEDAFEAITSAQLQELTSRPNSVADRLIGDLVHQLGVAKEFSAALMPEQEPTE